MSAVIETSRAVTMEAYFNDLADGLDQALMAGERYTASFSAESTDFVRMNRGKVRQPGHVSQRYLSVQLVRGTRHASHALSLTGDPAADRNAARDALAGLRGVLADLADDPHLMLPDTVASSRSTRGGPLPDTAELVDTILDAAKGEDLVGMLAAGPVQRGFADSQGQRNWHEVTTFNLQWSLYFRGDKAVKSTYAGLAWDAQAFERRMHHAREQLVLKYEGLMKAKKAA